MPVANWTLNTLLEGWTAPREGPNPLIGGLSLDSRRVRPGDLFLACAGVHEHGVRYAAQALERGAVAIAWEPVEGGIEVPDLSVPRVAVQGLSERLGQIADRFYDQPSRAMTVVGVTGTDGKTSVSQFMAQALHQAALPCGVIGTLGYGLYGEPAPASHTTPDALRVHALIREMRAKQARWLVMEASSHALDQGRVNAVAFDMAVFTNLTREHLDYHGDMTAYGAAKRRLFAVPSLKYAVVNLDDAYGRTLCNEVRGRLEVLGYGMDAAAHYPVEAVVAHEVEYSPEGFRAQVRTPWGEGELEAQLLGRFNVMNLLAVLAALLKLGVALPDALLRLSRTRTAPGRMQALHRAGRPLAVVDYAHTPAALEHVLKAVREHCAGRLWCVFGCGGDRDAGKRALMGALAERLADEVIITDDNPRSENPAGIVQDILAGLDHPGRTHVEHDRGRAIAHALVQAAPDDLVLIAGKGHETVQIVGDERLAFSDVDEVLKHLDGGGA